MYNFSPFKRQLSKMVKHAQTIRRQLPTNCLGMLYHFFGLALKGLSVFAANEETEDYSELAVTSKMCLLVKIVHKNLHLRCLIGF